MLFLKLSGVSFIYAISLFLQVELFVNQYRIEKYFDLGDLGGTISWVNFLIFIMTTIICYYFTHRLFFEKKVKYVLSILWIPIFVSFIKIFANAYPITDQNDTPLPGIGLLVLLYIMAYPVYIIFINVIVSLRSKKQMK
ncbi:hypothetical protein MH117_00630 [Paenibacillus sp. ACRRX]|uniref:hypothetical protein n=1 Tax=Paenibacillus sp. ACRRX TaxID=2918206 RepID=UPI001EF73B9A|nr:hypothetical protein [Paenibacillus sp. ACRRX]MCG7405910.1 hypothetical protein [Paenibacillus sp. ACRRX]